MPAWSFYSNFYDTFLEENQNTFGISIYAWNVLKVYNLGIFLVGGDLFRLEGKNNSPEVLM